MVVNILSAPAAFGLDVLDFRGTALARWASAVLS
jgi:hypothetical protein